MTRMSKRLQGDLGKAVYEASCHYDADDKSIRRVIGGISDVLDAAGIDPELFEQAAGWDDEDRTHSRLARMRRINDGCGHEDDHRFAHPDTSPGKCRACCDACRASEEEA